ncbi:MAG: polymerase subunit epsilon [Pseudomonadota bacterium]|nr:polymerase subunit epsilon [Pseudomonadota bacterium]
MFWIGTNLMTRQIVLDTETTGIGHDAGHRIIEIGCVELLDRRLTGRHFHRYINPERLVDMGAFKVHGISNEFLADKPKFVDIYEDFLEFVKDSELIIHNAPFDVGFLNAELSRIKTHFKIQSICLITDTLDMAKRLHPGQRNSLDALCKRYQVDAADRVLHGALLDAQLLADVYMAMTSGQKKMELGEQVSAMVDSVINTQDMKTPVYLANEEECQAHEDFISMILKKSGQVIWSETKEK